MTTEGSPDCRSAPVGQSAPASAGGEDWLDEDIDFELELEKVEEVEY